MNHLEIKSALLEKCHLHIANRRTKVENVISDIMESLEDETKSSAGDKHETGRAMLQIDREQAGEQLKEIGKIEEALSKVDIKVKSDYVRLGSVVHTTTNRFFIAVSAGEIKVDGRPFYAVALSSPMGQLLLGKKKGDVVRFRESDITITSVY
ncbi:3-oxoacyl-ACP synthase [Dokdonia sinensis]|uniref:3-oxoacyl-ACP synthase n=1 Tax=Dokdonia sinensis TaxID=2479847 RepID=A0A3M0G0Q0_9FLAO|nr:3-oxoacyl-ACP synthase [Dokdonia sinensis]RMB58540.1 3-oxoacyl-ACP synthase [Dokdonia sinensis]